MIFKSFSCYTLIAIYCCDPTIVISIRSVMTISREYAKGGLLEKNVFSHSTHVVCKPLLPFQRFSIFLRNIT